MEPVTKFGFLFPQYHLHLALTWFPPTFALGHLMSQRLDAVADSLIFAARKPAARSRVATAETAASSAAHGAL